MGIFDWLKRKNKNIECEDGVNEIYRNNGRGSLDVKYELKNGKMDGFAEFYYKNGNVKEEQNWKNGKKDGFSRIYYEDGTLDQEGNWKNDKKDGTFKYYDKNGQLERQEKWENGFYGGVKISKEDKENYNRIKKILDRNKNKEN